MLRLSSRVARSIRTRTSPAAAGFFCCPKTPVIRKGYISHGITPDKRVAFYCGTGWRASETWFYAYLMDWPRIAVYDGGWFEWSKDPVNNPIEVGEPAVVAGPSAAEVAA